MKDILRLSLPLTIWLVSFSAIYGLHGVLCQFDWSGLSGPFGMLWGRLVLVAAWAVAVVLQAMTLVVLLTPRFGGPPGFMRSTTLTLAIVALVAAAWTMFPVAVLSLCL